MSRNSYNPTTQELTTFGGWQAVDDTMSNTSHNPLENSVITGAFGSVEQSIAPKEDGTTVSQNYAIGEKFFRGNVLYKAKTAISSGTVWTNLVLNTNYELADSVTSELQALTNKIGNGTPTTSNKTIIGAINELYGDIFTKQELNIADVFTPSDANAVNMTTSKAYKIGRKIILQITGVGSITIGSNRRYIVGVLKSAYRPSIIQHFAASVNAATTGEVMAPVTGYASTSGNVALIFVEPGAIGNASYPWTSYGLFVTYDLI